MAINVVTIVGTASYTSGDQKWNGAAPTLNKKPTLKIKREKCIKCVCIPCEAEPENKLMLCHIILVFSSFPASEISVKLVII